MTAMIARVRTLRLIWGDEGRGAFYLSAAFAVTLLLGLTLQLLALRSLPAREYAVFVFGLGFGNVANAAAVAVQPIVAVRYGRPDSQFLPAAPAIVLALGIALVAAGTLAFSASAGTATALLATLQVPLHVVVGVGLGSLQARRAFPRMALALALWSVARVVVAALLLGLVHPTGLVFVSVLPAALLAELLLLIVMGAYRGVAWRKAEQSAALVSHYGAWGLFGWLMNCDAVFARVLLPAQQAGAYAVALTLGMIPVYVAGPLAMVLLPVVLHGHPNEQRARLWAVFGVGALLLAATLLGIGVSPRLVLTLLSGHGTAGADGLIRGYAVVGPLSATASLLITFVFGLGASIRARALAALAVAGAVIGLSFVRTPEALLVLQGLLMAGTVAVYLDRGLRATGRPESPSAATRATHR